MARPTWQLTGLCGEAGGLGIQPQGREELGFYDVTDGIKQGRQRGSEGEKVGRLWSRLGF